jgi:glycine/D-amino acid oxidase-like deaminating enzyme
VRQQTLCLASSAQDLIELRAEQECRRHFGFDARLLESGALHGEHDIRAPGAMICGGDAAMDPYLFTQGLLRAGIKQGLRVFSRTPVKRIEEHPAHVRLQAGGGEISAKSAILCTGYAASEFLGLTPGRLSTTYALASEPMESLDSWPAGHLLWETARPYFYARSTQDDRLIIGGEDTPGTFDHHNEERVAAKTVALLNRVRELFPRLPFVPDCAWAGTFAETKDGLPYIGRLPGRANIYAALGYGGNGITFGMIAARLLVDLIVGRPNEDAAVFAFEP